MNNIQCLNCSLFLTEYLSLYIFLSHAHFSSITHDVTIRISAVSRRLIIDLDTLFPSVNPNPGIDPLSFTWISCLLPGTAQLCPTEACREPHLFSLSGGKKKLVILSKKKFGFVWQNQSPANQLELYLIFKTWVRSS